MDGCLQGEPIDWRPELAGPAPPGHPAARRPARTRLWYIRVLDSPNKKEYKPNLKPGHTTSGSGRSGARPCGRAMPGRRGRRWVGSPGKQPSFLPSRASKTTVLNVSPEARTSEISCKPMEEQNSRLTTGLKSVYPRDIGRSSFMAADQCTDAY